jgi:hypothetical protein
VPKIAYEQKKLGAAKLDIIAKANAILEEYRGKGYVMTLRQLYYQFVARGLLAENSQRQYNNIKNAMIDGRMCGHVDWTSLVDMTRGLESPAHWKSPADIIKGAADGFALDKWATQRWRPEVWIEKDALVGVIAPVCRELQVPYLSCRGYASLSEVWLRAQTMRGHLKRGQSPYVIHLGDHDPSGIDMTRDIEDRLRTFMGGTGIERVALNFDQVEEYQPPANFAKTTDSRHGAYFERFGEESWELDALPPDVIGNLIRGKVEELRDQGAWDEVEEEEERHRKNLGIAADRWEEVEEFLGQE